MKNYLLGAISLAVVYHFTTSLVSAQSVSTLMGARSIGLGHASATLQDEWSLFNNVGGLGKTSKSYSAFSYESRLVLTGADRMATLVVAPFRSGAAGVGIFRFGDDVYNEQFLRIGYGNHIGNTSLGVCLNYLQYHAQGFGNRTAISVNVGGVTQLTPYLTVGAYITNLNQPTVAQGNEKLPAKLSAGIAAQPNTTLLLLVEIEKDLSHAATIKAGLEYGISKKVKARTGFNLHPNNAFFGLGFIIRKLTVDYAFQYSMQLNAAHQASLIYRLERLRKKHEK